MLTNVSFGQVSPSTNDSAPEKTGLGSARRQGKSFSDHMDGQNSAPKNEIPPKDSNASAVGETEKKPSATATSGSNPVTAKNSEGSAHSAQQSDAGSAAQVKGESEQSAPDTIQVDATPVGSVGTATEVNETTETVVEPPDAALAQLSQVASEKTQSVTAIGAQPVVVKPTAAVQAAEQVIMPRAGDSKGALVPAAGSGSADLETTSIIASQTSANAGQSDSAGKTGLASVIETPQVASSAKADLSAVAASGQNSSSAVTTALTDDSKAALAPASGRGSAELGMTQTLVSTASAGTQQPNRANKSGAAPVSAASQVPISASAENSAVASSGLNTASPSTSTLARQTVPNLVPENTPVQSMTRSDQIAEALIASGTQQSSAQAPKVDTTGGPLGRGFPRDGMKNAVGSDVAQREIVLPNPGESRNMTSGSDDQKIAAEVSRAPGAVAVVQSGGVLTNTISEAGPRARVRELKETSGSVSPTSSGNATIAPAPTTTGQIGTVQQAFVAQVQALGAEQISTVVHQADAFLMGSEAALDTPGLSQLLTEAVLQPGTVHRPETPRLVAMQLAEAFAAKGERNVDVALNPEELGRVKMRVSTSDNGIIVVIQTERPETGDLMRRHINELADEFRKMGFENISFEFNGGGASNDQSAGDGSGQTNSGAGGTETSEEMAAKTIVETATQHLRFGNSGVDMRV